MLARRFKIAQLEGKSQPNKTKMLEINKIQEVFKGHFQVILDFPDATDLPKILDETVKYVWGIEHKEGGASWLKYNHTLFGKPMPMDLISARQIELEFLVETEAFFRMIPFIHQTTKLIQTNFIPPVYLDLKKFEGLKRYQMLQKEVDYLFELEMPGATDYATLISPSIDFLEGVVAAFK